MNIRENLAHACVSIVLRGLDPDTGGALTHKRISELLTQANEIDQSAIPAAINRLQRQVDLLQSYASPNTGGNDG